MSHNIVDQFIEMVKIDSESGNEEPMMKYLEQYFAKNFPQAKVMRDMWGNFIAKLPAKSSDKTETIMLSCHADTVKPGIGIEPEVENGVIRSKGDTILGADDKAGIAEVIGALHKAEQYPPIEFVVSRQEEVGLLGVKNLDYSLLSAKMGFLMDGDTLDTIIIGGPSYITIDAEITGRSAHAGMEPEKGISAILAASNAITHLQLGRLDEKSTANVGIINGGTIRNGVPDKCTFAAECRSLDHARAIQLSEEMKATIIRQVESNGARADVKIECLCEAVDIPEDSAVVEMSKAAIKSIGLEPKTTFITGFTDASIYNNKNIPTAVLGIGAQLEHSTNEHIAVKDMEMAVQLLLQVFKLSA